MPLRAAWFLPHVQRGGYGTIRTRNAAKPLSSISLIPLWLSPVNRPSRFRRERKAGTRATPPKSGGACDPDSGTERRTSIPVPWGSLSTSFIPAGRLRKTPLFPRASSCRIGPRRQVFASPLRALDGSAARPAKRFQCSLSPAQVLDHGSLNGPLSPRLRFCQIGPRRQGSRLGSGHWIET